MENWSDCEVIYIRNNNNLTLFVVINDFFHSFFRHKATAKKRKIPRVIGNEDELSLPMKTLKNGNIYQQCHVCEWEQRNIQYR